MTLLKYTLRYPFLILVLAAGILACGDNPVDSGNDDDDNHDEHSEAHGLRLVLDGVEVYRVLDGQVTCEQEPCGIEVPEGSETTLITTEFLNDEGNEIHAEDLDEEYSLAADVAAPDVAEIAQGDGPWNFRVAGREAGETRLQVQLLHAGHADFTTPPLTDSTAIEIRVTQDQ